MKFSRAKRIFSPLNIYQKTRKLYSSLEKSNMKFLPPITVSVTNKEAIENDFGLKAFLNKTYVCTGGGILATVGSGIFFAEHPGIIFEYFPLLMGGGFVSAIGGCFGMDSARYNIITTNIHNPETGEMIEAYHSENDPARIASFAAVIGGITCLISPVVAFAHWSGTLIPAMLSTSFIFGGAVHYAKTCKVGELDIWRSALHSGLWGILGCGLTGLGSTLLFGPNMFSAFIHSVDVYAGIPLFAGLVAYDTHLAIEMYQAKDPDHLGCSTGLYLDFVNILVRVIEIMVKTQERKD